MGDREKAGSVSSWEGGGEMGREVAESVQGPTQNCATHARASGDGNLVFPTHVWVPFFILAMPCKQGGILVPQADMEPAPFI